MHLHTCAYVLSVTCMCFMQVILRTTIPMAELVVNLFATLVWEFVGDAWNWFDFVVVAVSLVSLVHSIPHPSIILHPSSFTHHPSPVSPRGLFPRAFILERAVKMKACIKSSSWRVHLLVALFSCIHMCAGTRTTYSVDNRNPHTTGASGPSGCKYLTTYEMLPRVPLVQEVGEDVGNACTPRHAYVLSQSSMLASPARSLRYRMRH